MSTVSSTAVNPDNFFGQITINNFDTNVDILKFTDSTGTLDLSVGDLSTLIDSDATSDVTDDGADVTINLGGELDIIIKGAGTGSIDTLDLLNSAGYQIETDDTTTVS